MSIRHIRETNYKTNTSKNIIVTNQTNRYRMLIAGKENKILKQTQNNKFIIINFTHSSLLPVSLSNFRIKQSLVIGRVIMELGVLTLTMQTTPDLSGNVLTTLPRTHFNLCCISSTIKTMSFNCKFLFFFLEPFSPPRKIR